MQYIQYAAYVTLGKWNKFFLMLFVHSLNYMSKKNKKANMLSSD